MEITKQNTINGSGLHVSKKATPGPDARVPPSGIQGEPVRSTASSSGGINVMVSQLAQRMMSESSVDEARVARLATQIESGQYQVDPHRLAARMVDLDKSIQQTRHEQ
jgi:flagellar biosynthesis anti-sigma factor FlgM